MSGAPDGRGTSCGRAAGGLKLVVFDFDQTLSVVHVFKTLAGWSAAERGGAAEEGPFIVPPPFAMSEEGQLHRVYELNKGQMEKAGGFARLAFGGEKRVEEMDVFLKSLREGDVELMVCTKGLVGVVKKCLHDLQLLPHFTEVYGNVGSNYGMTPYDRDVAEAPDSLDAQARAFLGNDHQANWITKDRLIQALMQGRGLSRDQVVLVEDDPEEIRKADPVCRTLFVSEGAGMTSEHFSALLGMLGKPVAGNGAGARTRVRPAGRGARSSDAAPKAKQKLVWRVKRTPEPSNAAADEHDK